MKSLQSVYGTCSRPSASTCADQSITRCFSGFLATSSVSSQVAGTKVTCIKVKGFDDIDQCLTEEGMLARERNNGSNLELTASASPAPAATFDLTRAAGTVAVLGAR